MQAATVLALCLAFSQMLGKRSPKEEIFFMFFLTRSFTRLLYSFENLALEKKTADGLLLISHKKIASMVNLILLSWREIISDRRRVWHSLDCKNVSQVL